MKILFLLVVVVLAILVFRFLRSSAKPAARTASGPKRLHRAKAVTAGTNAYHAVSVISGPGACQQALALADKRFLPAELPQLPLADCTSNNCQCKFMHFDDRRDSESDKRAPTALRSELYTASGKPERRAGGGRRKGDQE
tara:strand:- start:171897 stop:172316 length:420 start_codon:yes stop_codon:yes gene_type:complete